MKRALIAAALLSLAPFVFAQRVDENDGKHTQLYPTKEKKEKDDQQLNDGKAKSAKSGGGANLVYWGGPVIANAQTVAIFWGPSATWGTNASPSFLVSELTSFFGLFGGTPEYKVITQYGVNSTNLTNRSWVDNSTPVPTAVSDSAIQSEVVNYILSHGGVIETNTIYEVFLPPGSYSYYGSSTSCGGPNVQYCAYHSNFSYGGKDVKYSSMPYPGCGGCQWPGFSVAQNFEHFACHETREAVTDPDGNAWFDRRGYEADDKCAWSPSPFIGTGGFGYQYEWSNSAGGCVKSQ